MLARWLSISDVRERVRERTAAFGWLNYYDQYPEATISILRLKDKNSAVRLSYFDPCQLVWQVSQVDGLRRSLAITRILVLGVRQFGFQLFDGGQTALKLGGQGCDKLGDVAGHANWLGEVAQGIFGNGSLAALAVSKL